MPAKYGSADIADDKADDGNDGIRQMRRENEYAGRKEYQIGYVRQTDGNRKPLATLERCGGNLRKPPVTTPTRIIATRSMSRP